MSDHAATGPELDELLEALPVGVLLLGADQRVVWHQPLAASLLGISGEELEGLHRDELPLAASTPLSAEHLLTPVHVPERRLKCWIAPRPSGGGETFVFLADVTPLLQGVKSRTLGLDRRESLRVDEESGLLSRKAVLQSLVGEVSRSRRYGNPLSVMLIRIEGQAGEEAEALRVVAQALQDQLRWVDVLGRWGPDTLLLVLPETPAEAAAILPEKFADALEGTPVAKTGVASWEKGDDALSLVDRCLEGLERGERSPPMAESA
ncbi:MAG: diguanylate cyclase [Gammaproteobacteria bacterium]|nr:MAG: diguanylate cyclase [Gammaproteobacteria bacterium]